LRADAARNRQALIDAAQRVFAARGLAATLDEIAAEAGVNVATAYRHFANKHELAAAFLEEKIDEAIAIAEESAAAPDPAAGLADFLARILELMTENRGVHDVFTPGYADHWLVRLEQRVDPLVEDLLARAQAQGAVRADVGAGDLGVLLQMLGTVADVAGDDQTLRRRYLAVVLDGLRPSDTLLPGAAPDPADVRTTTASGRGTRR
jgi:AcrR family transcriptional regulator